VSPASPKAAVRVGRRSIDISSPDKLLFPGEGITKLELAEHYARVAPLMLPHARDRPITMHVFPGGLDAPGVYIKKAPPHFPDWIPRVTVEKRDGQTSMALAREAATFVFLAGQNCITPHVWPARADDLRKPDRLIFDFDPPEGTGFADVRAAALATGDLLRELGLVPFAQTSGSRGLHVIAPVRRDSPFEDARSFAHAVGERLATEDDRFTVAFRIAKRGGRIYIDTTRNAYAQHSVAPFAVRAKPGAPVAVPLRWDELSDGSVSSAGQWTVRTLQERLDDVGDPWKGMGRSARSLRRAAARLGP
jgi:bifunctional non-homologous end joining protein LigD